MRTAIGVAVAWLLVAGVGAAHADAPAGADVDAELGQANAALQRGDYQDAADRAAAIARLEVEAADLTEAWRVYGLALFFLVRHGEAEGALLEYLKRDVDAHLDPALVPPEAIVFFEDVRSRHSAELRKFRPPPETTARTFLKNFLPPWGQIQNGHAGRAWMVGIAEVVFLGAHLTSYFVFRAWCDPVLLTCKEGDNDHTSAARSLRLVNLVSGVLFVGVYSYGVIDGMVQYRRLRRRPPVDPRTLSVGVVPTADGAYLSVVGRF